MFKRYEESKFLVDVLVVTNAIFIAMTGLFFITAPVDISGPTYTKMQELMPLDIYGLIMLASATLLLYSIFRRGKNRHQLMFLGGMLGTLALALYASASTLGAVNIMLPLRYSLIACTSLLIASAGGIGLWINKRD